MQLTVNEILRQTGLLRTSGVSWELKNRFWPMMLPAMPMKVQDRVMMVITCRRCLSLSACMGLSQGINATLMGSRACCVLANVVEPQD